MPLTFWYSKIRRIQFDWEAINVDERRTLEVSFDVRTWEDSPYCGRAGLESHAKSQPIHEFSLSLARFQKQYQCEIYIYIYVRGGEKMKCVALVWWVL